MLLDECPKMTQVLDRDIVAVHVVNNITAVYNLVFLLIDMIGQCFHRFRVKLKRLDLDLIFRVFQIDFSNRFWLVNFNAL